MPTAFFEEIIETIKKEKPNKERLSRIKISLCFKYRVKDIPTDISILLNAEVSDIPKITKCLLTKPVRTISGVAVVAIMTKPFLCPHTKKGIGPCIMCPGGVDSHFGNVPQSYTGKEPATRRAIRNLFDPYLQVMNRLEQYVASGHMPEKIELIIMGGTFPSFPKNYRENFVKYAFKAMNDFSSLFFKKSELDIVKFKQFFELPGKVDDIRREASIRKKLLLVKEIELNGDSIKKIDVTTGLKKIKSKKTERENSKERIFSSSKVWSKPKLCEQLKKEQLSNETSSVKCVGLTIETRPDYGMLKHGNEMLSLGCTRIELGVQTIYDEVLEKINRGHLVQDSIDSTRILKDLGFKINYHVMPGLPFTTDKQDSDALKEYFSNHNFRPDMLKIYPAMVLKGTGLYDLWKKGKYAPLSTEKAAELIAYFKTYVPPYVRIMRVQRDIPTFMTEDGVSRTNLRQYIHEMMEEKGTKCSCIRCREIGDREIGAVEIKSLEYEASHGKEYFISAECKGRIAGFCRLRIPSQQLRREITKNSALIRELHVYGTSTGIGKKGSVQHHGIGKQLLDRAVEIARKQKKNKLVVISGIGAREYYRKLGYRKEGPYMLKRVA